MCMINYYIKLANYRLYLIVGITYIFASFGMLALIAILTQSIVWGLITAASLIGLYFPIRNIVVRVSNCSIEMNENGINLIFMQKMIKWDGIEWFKLVNQDQYQFDMIDIKPFNEKRIRFVFYKRTGKEDNQNWNLFKNDLIANLNKYGSNIRNYYDAKKWDYVIWGLLASYALIPAVMVILGLNREQIIKTLPQILIWVGVSMAYIGNIFINRKKSK